MESTEAILLRRNRLTDTSLVLSWLTLHNGRVRMIAKGVLRPKNPLFGKLDLFYRCDIAYAPSKRNDLHTLREAVLLETMEGIRLSYPRLTVAGYFSELIEVCTEQDTPLPELYDLLNRALHFLDANEPTIKAVVFFEKELCRLLGLHDGRQKEASPILLQQHPQLRTSHLKIRQLTAS